MTVEQVGEGYVSCLWFEGSKIIRETFIPAVLTRA
jgi:uncharacterized protein YodC (DUF2158 family)